MSLFKNEKRILCADNNCIMFLFRLASHCYILQILYLAAITKYLLYRNANPAKRRVDGDPEQLGQFLLFISWQ